MCSSTKLNGPLGTGQKGTSDSLDLDLSSIVIEVSSNPCNEYCCKDYVTDDGRVLFGSSSKELL
jgi:hypothetical protein